MIWQRTRTFVRNLCNTGRTVARPEQPRRLSFDRLEGRDVPSASWIDGDFSLGADDQLDVTLTRGDTLPGDRIRVRGSVTIDEATLNIVELGETTRPGNRFTIIENDGNDPVQGHFAGLPEGTVLTMPDRAKLQISYEGGPGDNDVVLTRINSAPTFINRTLTSSISEGLEATLSGTIVDPDPLDRFFLNVDWGDGVRESFRFGPNSPRDVAVNHAYADDAEVYTVRLSWGDQVEFSNSAELTTTVRNVAPVIAPLGDVRIGVGDTLRRVVSFTDPGDDDWTATVDYGDGSRPVTLTPDRFQRFNLTHAFDKAGVYEVSVTVADDDGGIDSISFRVIVE